MGTFETIQKDINATKLLKGNCRSITVSDTYSDHFMGFGGMYWDAAASDSITLNLELCIPRDKLASNDLLELQAWLTGYKMD